MATDNAITKLSTVDDSTEFPQTDGLLGMIMAYSERCSVSSHPLFNLAGAINLIGHVAGQQIQGPTGLRTNFYNIIVGFSGCGKEAPVRSSKYITQCRGLERFRITDDITSGAALLRNMAWRGPKMYLTMDEMGRTLSNAQSKSSSQNGLVTLFMKLFTKSDSTYEKTYANPGSCFVIYGPHLNILGSSTPDEFFEAVGLSDIASGFLPRCLFFPSSHKPLRKGFSTDTETGLREIVGRLYRISILAGDGPPMSVQPTKKASAIIEEFGAYCDEKQQGSYKDTLAGPIYNRLFEHGLKLCLIHSISRWDTINPQEIGIEAVDCEWGFGFAKLLVGWLAENAAKTFTGGDRHAKLLKKIIRIIEQCQAEHNKPCTRKHLQENMHLKGNELNTCLTTLIDAGDIEELPPVKNRNKTVTRLFIIAGEDSDL